MTSKPAPKKKLNRADYMFNQQEGATLVKRPGDIEGLDFAIRYLTNCTASVFDHTAQVSAAPASPRFEHTALASDR